MDTIPVFSNVFDTKFVVTKLDKAEQAVVVDAVRSAESSPASYAYKATTVRDILCSRLGGFWNCVCGGGFSHNILYAKGGYAMVETTGWDGRLTYVVWLSPRSRQLTKGSGIVPQHLLSPVSEPLYYVQNTSTRNQELCVVNLFRQCQQSKCPFPQASTVLKDQLEQSWGRPFQVCYGLDSWGCAVQPAGDVWIEFTCNGHRVLVFRHTCYLRDADQTPFGFEHVEFSERLRAKRKMVEPTSVSEFEASLVGLINRRFRLITVLFLLFALAYVAISFVLFQYSGVVSLALSFTLVLLRGWAALLAVGGFATHFRVSWIHLLANLVGIGGLGYGAYEFAEFYIDLAPVPDERLIEGLFIAEFAILALTAMFWIRIWLGTNDQGTLRFQYGYVFGPRRTHFVVTDGLVVSDPLDPRLPLAVNSPT